MIPAHLRRPVGIVALVGGLLAAFWTLHRDVQSVRVSLLLTHLEHPYAGGTLGRDRLVGLRVTVHNGDRPFVLERSFRRGGAPEATLPLDLELEGGDPRVTVRCAFDAGGSEPVYGFGRLVVRRQEALQVVDAGLCADPR
ncbi:MAG: hypothetical protein RIT45_4160 [Pseudomonadota bacterium]